MEGQQGARRGEKRGNLALVLATGLHEVAASVGIQWVHKPTIHRQSEALSLITVTHMRDAKYEVFFIYCKLREVNYC